MHSETEIPIKIQLNRSKSLYIFGIASLFIIGALLLWKLQNTDTKILLFFNRTYENEIFLRTMKFFSKYGLSMITLSYALLAYLSLQHRALDNNRMIFFLLIISFALGTFAGDVLKVILDRARPALIFAGKINIDYLSKTPAFPSGHATKSMALVLPFLLFARHRNALNLAAKFFVLFIASGVCFSRVAIQAHYTSDVLGGIGIALLLVPFSVWLTNLFYIKRRISSGRLGKLTQRLVFIFLALSIFMYMI